MNRKNLLKLAQGLEGPLRAEFAMTGFADVSITNLSLNSCGTVGCAVGHAAYLVEPRQENEGWFAFSERLFGMGCGGAAWAWCFDENWTAVDDTPKGAAARIRYLLEHGKPPRDWHEQLFGRAPLCYATTPQACEGEG